MNKEIMDIVLKLVIAVTVTLITKYLIPYFKSKCDSEKFNDFLLMVEKCVESANQLYTPEQWAVKKKYVLDLVEQYAAEHGIQITAEEINAIIEGFVIALKG